VYLLYTWIVPLFLFNEFLFTYNKKIALIYVGGVLSTCISDALAYLLICDN
jgi:hypothetical protein